MSEINWIRLGKEIAQTPNGFGVLRLLQAHGVNQFTQIVNGSTGQCCSVDVVLDYAHKEK